MTAIPFPVLSAPGRKPQSAGGRLVNCFPEKLSGSAGEQYIYWRVPGLKAFGTAATETNFRGALQVGSAIYAVFGSKAYTFPSSGGAGTALSGTVPGTAPVIMARDNAATPHIAIVSPGDGVVQIAAGAVSSWPDADVGQPNSVEFMRGAFFFTYGDGKIRNSGINSTSINTLDEATAESKPDTLYRAIQLGNGQMLMVGSSSCEVWGGQFNDTGFLLNYIATIPRGIVGPYAITGSQDGWGKGLFAVGDDLKVHRLDGYEFTPISPVELDTLIEAETDRTAISISVYVAQGRGYVVVQGSNWCWEFDTVLQSWHERQSHLLSYWRGRCPFNAFGKWYCGATSSNALLEISPTTHDEVGYPLRMRIETGPLGGFPQVLRINGIELYLTKGVGIATGSDPVQTDPDIEISISRDGGTSWSAGRIVKAGRQSISNLRARSSLWGQAEVQGVRWRFDESSSVPFGFMGADMQADVLR